MKIVISGFSLDDARSVEALRGIYDWSKENRGMIGTSVDLPFDVINYPSLLFEQSAFSSAQAS
jgi:hypothetical protein